MKGEIDQLDRELADRLRRRRELARALRESRHELYPVIAPNGRRPALDGAVQLPPARRGAIALYGRRLRAACHAILARAGVLTLPELHALLHHNDFAVASSEPVKALADAMGYETDIGRVRRVRRGVYESLRPPSSRPLWRDGPSILDLRHD